MRKRIVALERKEGSVQDLSRHPNFSVNDLIDLVVRTAPFTSVVHMNAWQLLLLLHQLGKPLSIRGQSRQLVIGRYLSARYPGIHGVNPDQCERRAGGWGQSLQEQRKHMVLWRVGKAACCFAFRREGRVLLAQRERLTQITLVAIPLIHKWSNLSFGNLSMDSRRSITIQARLVQHYKTRQTL